MILATHFHFDVVGQSSFILCFCFILCYFFLFFLCLMTCVSKACMSENRDTLIIFLHVINYLFLFCCYVTFLLNGWQVLITEISCSFSGAPNPFAAKLQKSSAHGDSSCDSLSGEGKQQRGPVLYLCHFSNDLFHKVYICPV